MRKGEEKKTTPKASFYLRLIRLVRRSCLLATCRLGSLLTYQQGLTGILRELARGYMVNISFWQSQHNPKTPILIQSSKLLDIGRHMKFIYSSSIELTMKISIFVS